MGKRENAVAVDQAVGKLPSMIVMSPRKRAGTVQRIASRVWEVQYLHDSAMVLGNLTPDEAKILRPAVKRSARGLKDLIRLQNELEQWVAPKKRRA